MKFGDDEEHEGVEHAHVIGMNTDEVHVKAMRVREHGHQVREHEDEEKESRRELNEPKGRVFVTEHLVVSLDVTELTIGRREATKSAESVNNNEQRDEANEDHVEDRKVFTAEEHTTRGVDQVSKEVLADLHRARESHVAEEEDTEENTSHGLGNVSHSGRTALALGILKANTPNIFGGGRRVGILNGIRGRHLSFPLRNAISDFGMRFDRSCTEVRMYRGRKKLGVSCQTV